MIRSSLSITWLLLSLYAIFFGCSVYVFSGSTQLLGVCKQFHNTHMHYMITIRKQCHFFTYQFWIKQYFLVTECWCFRSLKLPLHSLINLIIKCVYSRSHEALFLQKLSKELSAFNSCDKTNKKWGEGEVERHTRIKSTQVPGKNF